MESRFVHALFILGIEAAEFQFSAFFSKRVGIEFKEIIDFYGECFTNSLKGWTYKNESFHQLIFITKLIVQRRTIPCKFCRVVQVSHLFLESNKYDWIITRMYDEYELVIQNIYLELIH